MPDGCRHRDLTLWAGTIKVAISKLRQGSYSTELLRERVKSPSRFNGHPQ